MLSFMLSMALLGIMTVSTGATAEMYIGTYTSADGSKGIYRSTLNLATGQLSTPTLAVKTPGPSFVALSPDGKNLFSLDEYGSGEVSSFAISPDGSLTAVSKSAWPGGGPCHVSVDPKGKVLFAAAYGGGSAASFPIEEGGKIGPVASVLQNRGSGPNHGRQEGPHMHSIYSDAKGKFVYACDLGTDEILIFKVDAKTGKISLQPDGRHHVAPGGGPRHIAFSPNGKFAYVNLEMKNEVVALAVDAKTGGLTELQTLTTLPSDHPAKPNTTAEIACHPSGKFLYVSNRGEDSIASYAVGKDGRLSLIGIASAEIHEPRSFSIDATGKWMVVAGQNSNDLTTLQIDPKSGMLHPTGFKVPISKPVCVVFR